MSERIEWMCRQVPGAHVLDIGCGHGLAALIVARGGGRVVGVDCEPSIIELATSRLAQQGLGPGGRVELAVARAESLPFADASFDAALMGDLIEHLADPEAALREAWRVLRPRSRLVLTSAHAGPEPLLAVLLHYFEVVDFESLDRGVGVVARRSEGKESPRRVAREAARRRIAEENSQAGESSEPAAAKSVGRPAESPAQISERLGVAALRAGKPGEAAARFRDALRTSPDDLDLLLRLARAERASGAAGDSYRSVQRALELRPGWQPAVWYGLTLVSGWARPLERFGLLVGALGPLADLGAPELTRLAGLARRAGDWSTVLSAGELLLAAGQLDQGIFLTASAKWETGCEDEALTIVEHHDRSSDPDAQAGCARFFQHIGRPEQAATSLPSLWSVDSRLLMAIGRALIGHDRPRQALDVIGRALAQNPADPRALAARRSALSALRLAGGPPRARDGGAALRLEPRPGRILHLLPRSLPHHHSGGTQRTQYTAKAQLGLGLDPHLVTRLDFPWSVAPDATMCDLVDGVPYYRLRDGRGLDRADEQFAVNCDLAAALTEQLRPSLLHAASDSFNAMVAFDLRRRFGLPVLYEVRSFPMASMARRRGSRTLSDPWVTRRRLERHAWQEADHIVTLAEVMKAHIVSHGVSDDKVTVVPNAVDLERFFPRPRDAQLADELAITPGDRVLGYVSTLNRYEGIEFLIDATSRLRDEGRAVKCLVVGDGEEKERLQGLARELGIDGHVVFTGGVPHEDVQRYYSIIDVFVVPRTDEPTCRLVTPLKPYEAMAMGCPVVVSRVPALGEMIIEEETGLSFTPEDPEDLAEVLRPLLDQPRRREALSRRALDWVRANRTWSANAERYRELYAELQAT